MIKKTKNKGQIGIGLIGVFGFIFVLAAVLYATTTNELTTSRNTYERVKALEAAEGGVNVALYNIKAGLRVQVNPANIFVPPNPTCYNSTDYGTNYSGSDFTACWVVKAVIPGTYVDSVLVRVVSDGYVPSISNKRITRRVEAEYIIGANTPLGQQITFNTTGWFDQGGAEIDKAGFTGPIFSNGPLRLLHNELVLKSTLVQVADNAISFAPWNASSYHIDGVCGGVGPPNCSTIGELPGFPATVQGLRISDLNVVGAMQCNTQTNTFPLSCLPSVSNPQQSNPVTPSVIAALKSAAAANGTIAGNTTCAITSFARTKITGNLTLPNNCEVEIKGTLWITGNLTLNNNSVLALDCDTFGPTGDEAIVVDGRIIMENGSALGGTNADPYSGAACVGSVQSYALGISNYVNTAKTYPGDLTSAIEVKNTANQSILVSPQGWTHINNTGSVRITAVYGLKIDNNATGITGDTLPVVINPGAGQPVTISNVSILYHDCKPQNGTLNDACPPTLLGP